jgi:sorbitol-specific phosphotransferase system component IIC
MSKSNISTHLTWVVPLMISILIAGFNIYSLIGRVDKIEHTQNSLSKEYIHKIDSLEYRVGRVEEFCCDEIKK